MNKRVILKIFTALLLFISTIFIFSLGIGNHNNSLGFVAESLAYITSILCAIGFVASFKSSAKTGKIAAGLIIVSSFLMMVFQPSLVLPFIGLDFKIYFIISGIIAMIGASLLFFLHNSKGSTA